jgi:predicted RNA-binding Zn-ribbon protein involved in translation (DUF1610 family)
MTDVDNTQDVLDSRDIIARIEELESQLGDAVVRTACKHCGQDIEGRDDDWRDRGNNSTCPNEAGDAGQEHEPTEGTSAPSLPDDEAEELAALKALQDEAEGYCSDWQHGATLIRDSYFEEYAEQFADDIGAIDRNASWPICHIDWKAAAESLQMDYTSVDFDGVTYWVR